MRALDIVLKVTMSAAVITASAGVTYYYAIYLPQRDAALDAQRALDAEYASRLQAEYANRLLAEQEMRAAAEKMGVERLKQQISSRYQSCLRAATANYAATWEGNCTRINKAARKSYDDCVSGLPKLACEKLYPVSTTAETCSLPTKLAETLNTDLENEKNRCLKEYQLGMR